MEWLREFRLNRVSIVVMAVSLIPCACGIFHGANKDESTPPGAKDPSPPVASAGRFPCGDQQCKKKVEFCITERFTTGGAVIAASCQPFNLVDGKDNCDSGRDALPEDLKNVPNGCFNDETSGELTLSFVDPDRLPLKDKFVDRVAKGDFTFTLLDSTLIDKINSVSSAYQSPCVEDGKIKGSPDVGLYCRVMAKGGFAAASIPFDVTKDRLVELEWLGSRKLEFRAGVAGPFAISFECYRQSDTTPFTVSDLVKIFGPLARFN